MEITELAVVFKAPILPHPTRRRGADAGWAHENSSGYEHAGLSLNSHLRLSAAHMACSKSKSLPRR